MYNAAYHNAAIYRGKMYGTRNFSLKNDPKLMCSCGHRLCDQRVVNQETLNRLQMMRDDLGGQDIKITSGARCPRHKNEVGREKTDHQSGDCVDIFCDDDLLLTKLLVLAGRYGATRVAYSKALKFVHVSFVSTHRRDVPTWKYAADEV